jgi:hypothetical protein
VSAPAAMPNQANSSGRSIVSKNSLVFTNDETIRVPEKMQKMNERAVAFLEEIFDRGFDKHSSNRRDFLVHLLSSKESGRLDFSRVQVPETVEDAEAKLNKFFTLILKYNPQVLSILPPKNITFTPAVTEHLVLHRQLAAAIKEYKDIVVLDQDNFYAPH